MSDKMGKKDASCPVCKIAQKDQHSLRESGICDGIRKGYAAPAMVKKGGRRA